MTAVQITDNGEKKLKELRLAYKKKHGANITYQMIVNKALEKLVLKDIE